MDNEVKTESEEREYTTYSVDGFKVRTSSAGLDSFKEKLKGKPKDEETIRAWLQAKMRLRDTKVPVDAGSFDMAAARLIDTIFRKEMLEARKQTRLTDVAPISDGQAKKTGQRCFRCHKRKEKHGVRGAHTCSNFQPAPTKG